MAKAPSYYAEKDRQSVLGRDHTAHDPNHTPSSVVPGTIEFGMAWVTFRQEAAGRVHIKVRENYARHRTRAVDRATEITLPPEIALQWAKALVEQIETHMAEGEAERQIEEGERAIDQILDERERTGL